MKSTAKSIATMRDLVDRLSFRTSIMTINTIRTAFDANGYPMAFLSVSATETAGNPVILLRMSPIDAVSKDLFGNANVAFTPHIMEFAYELDGTEAEPSRMDIMTVMQEIVKLGIKINIVEIADASAVTEANLNSTAVARSLEFDVVNPQSGI